MRKNTIEDYLSTIYKIYEGNPKNGIHSIDVANQLNISKPSVSAIIKKLTKQGYLIAKPYSRLFFTKKGLQKAKKITHNHRVIEYFLKEVLKCNLEDIHEEAHKLEHAFSEKTIKQLDAFLGQPKLSPYGKRIH